jgi:hypothetical protein
VNMDALEWKTYLALKCAGPRQRSEEPRLFGLPPWGRGEIADESMEEAEAAAHALRVVFAQRRSARDLSLPLPIMHLRHILALSLARPPEKPSARVYPTAGGCDELGILVAARRIEGLKGGAYWATTDASGSLLPAAPLEGTFEQFERLALPYLGLSSDDGPAAFLLILADWRKLSTRYEHCILASGLLDAGALLQTLSLAAADTGVNACICACIQPLLIASWLRMDCREIGHIGTLALGGTGGGRERQRKQ